jgi:hypothetical protein
MKNLFRFLAFSSYIHSPHTGVVIQIEIENKFEEALQYELDSNICLFKI